MAQLLYDVFKVYILKKQSTRDIRLKRDSTAFNEIYFLGLFYNHSVKFCARLMYFVYDTTL